MDTKACPACFQTIDARAVRCPSCTSRQPDAPIMHRHLPGKVMGGVCAAIALQSGLDPVLVRALFICSLAVAGPLGIWLYAILWLITPYEARGKSPAARFADWVGKLFKVTPASASGPIDF